MGMDAHLWKKKGKIKVRQGRMGKEFCERDVGDKNQDLREKREATPFWLEGLQ